MEKSSSVIRALVCVALSLVILISLFMPVVTFNSADKFDESKMGDISFGRYNDALHGADIVHAGKIKISIVSILLSSGKDVDTLTELYRLEELIKSADNDRIIFQSKVEAQKLLKAEKETELIGPKEAQLAKSALVEAKMAELSAIEAEIRVLAEKSETESLTPEESARVTELWAEERAKRAEITAIKTDKKDENGKIIEEGLDTINEKVTGIEAAIANYDRTINEIRAKKDRAVAEIIECEEAITNISDSISDEDDLRIQKKLRNESFLKKVALRAAMCNMDKGTSYLTFALVISLVAFAILALDIALKVLAFVKAGLKLDGKVIKAVTDYRLSIVAFILHMFTVQFYIAKTRGISSLGAGIIVGLAAMVIFAFVHGIAPILEAKEIGGDKYKKTIIKQSITAAVLIITVIIALLGMRMSALMVNDMDRHYTDFAERYVYGLYPKLDEWEKYDKIEQSMSMVVGVITAIPLLIYSALGYMLARVALVEKVRLKNSRRQKTPLGSFYIGFIFVTVAYLLSILVFSVSDSSKRYEMYRHCQMSIVFTEYEEDIDRELVANRNIHHDAITRENLSYMIEIYDEQLNAFKQEYQETDDKKTMAEIKSDINDIELEINAAEQQIDRIESCKRSTLVAIMILATVAIAAEVVFKMTKFEAEKIAEGVKEH